MLWLLLLSVALFLYYSGAFNKLFTTEQHPPADALNVLNERYARGELTTAEYDMMKKNLTRD